MSSSDFATFLTVWLPEHARWMYRAFEPFVWEPERIAAAATLLELLGIVLGPVVRWAAVSWRRWAPLERQARDEKANIRIDLIVLIPWIAFSTAVILLLALLG